MLLLAGLNTPTTTYIIAFVLSFRSSKRKRPSKKSCGINTPLLAFAECITGSLYIVILVLKWLWVLIIIPLSRYYTMNTNCILNLYMYQDFSKFTHALHNWANPVILKFYWGWTCMSKLHSNVENGTMVRTAVKNRIATH